MAERVDNTYQEQLQKLEKIANGVSLDTWASLMEALRHRQRAAQEVMESLKRNPIDVTSYITYFNSVNDIINELLITKL